MEYLKQSTQDVHKYMTALQEAQADGAKLDSAAVTDEAPQQFQTVLDEAGKNADLMVRALLDGAALYEREHGVKAPADVTENAIQMAYSTTRDAFRRYGLKSLALDSADSNHHDQISLQPNRAVVSILSAFTEAIPYAHYLPADIGSNEAKLAIMSHQAGVKFGQYEQNGSLDGADSGGSFISAKRLHTSSPAGGGAVTGKLTKIQTDANTCDPAAGDLKLLRGRAIVYVNGIRCASEAAVTRGSGNNSISGSIRIGGTEHVIGGTINTDTGEYALTSTPALPTTVKVSVESSIDFERQPDLTPSVISSVETFPLLASPWRVTTHNTIDTRTQMANELNLDPHAESILAIQTQFANERHREVIRKGLRIAVNNTTTFDWGQAKTLQDSGRAAVWADLSYPLAALSQQMALNTMNHGITHIYVTKNVLAQLRGLPASIFQSSGIADRPSIYRAGRLFGLYEVYYTPWELAETNTSAQILCVGRATDVARNPIVLGDAVAPMVLPLAVNSDLRQGSAFYARNFTELNPHQPSAMGFAMIEVTNF